MMTAAMVGDRLTGRRLSRGRSRLRLAGLAETADIDIIVLPSGSDRGYGFLTRIPECYLSRNLPAR